MPDNPLISQANIMISVAVRQQTYTQTYSTTLLFERQVTLHVENKHKLSQASSH